MRSGSPDSERQDSPAAHDAAREGVCKSVNVETLSASFEASGPALRQERFATPRIRLTMSMPQTVFLHSTGTGPFMWGPIADLLPAGERVLPLNLGYPPGPLLARGTNFQLADDVEHVLEQIPSGDLHLVAHSYGGLVALEFAERLGSRVRSMLLVEPVLFGALAKDPTAEADAREEAATFAKHPWFLTDESRGGTEEWLELFVDYWNRPGSWKRLPEAMRALSLAAGWKMFQEVRAVFFDPKTFDERVLPSIPVTLVRGERSPAASRAMVSALARRAPHAVVAELLGTGHMSPLTHPAKVRDALRDHLASIARATDLTDLQA